MPNIKELQSKILDIIQTNPLGKRDIRNVETGVNDSFKLEIGPYFDDSDSSYETIEPDEIEVNYQSTQA